MNIIHRITAIIITIAIIVFWSNDIVANGYFRQAVFPIMLWSFFMMLSILTIIFWNGFKMTKGNIFLAFLAAILLIIWTKDDAPESIIFFVVIAAMGTAILHSLQPISIRPLVVKIMLEANKIVVLFLALQIPYYFKEFEHIVSNSPLIFLDFIFSIITTFSLPVLTIFLPVFVLDFIENPKKKITFWITMVIYLVAFLVGSVQINDKIKHIVDPCYQIIQGKGPIWSIQKDRVCMVYDESALGYQYIATLSGADPGTFADISSGYFKDRNHVYYNSKVLNDVVPEAFHVLDYNCGTDGVNFFEGAKVVSSSCEKLNREGNF